MKKETVVDESGSVQVQIYDENYHLCGSEPDYIERLAAMVDAKIRAVAQHTATIDSQRLAVLAALNFADDYLQMKQQYEAREQETTNRASSLEHALDSALNEVLGNVRRAG